MNCALTIFEVGSNANQTKKMKKLEDFYHPYIEDIIIVDLKDLKPDLKKILELRGKVGRYCGLMKIR